MGSLDFQQPGLMGKITKQWIMLAPTRDDSQRDIKVLSWMLRDQDIKWYDGPAESIWYFTNFNPDEQSASIHLLNTNKWLWRQFDAVNILLKQVMDENALRKLYALIPAPAKQVKRIVRMLNFKHEGTLRESIKFDSQWRNLDIYSLLRREVGHGKGSRKVATQVA